MEEDLGITQTIRDSKPRSITPLDLLSSRDIPGYTGEISVSPNGSHIAFALMQARLQTNDYKITWFVAPIHPGGAAVDVGDGGYPILDQYPDGKIGGSILEMSPKWSPDGKWIYYTLKRDGAVQLWRSRSDGGKQEQLTDNDADLQKFALSKDGTKVFFAVGRDRKAQHEFDVQEAAIGYLVDERFNATASNKPLWPLCTDDEAIKDFFMPGSKYACNVTLWVYELGTGKERRAKSDEENEYEELLSSSRPPALTGDKTIPKIRYENGRTRVTWLENNDPDQFKGPFAPLTLFAANSVDGANAEHCPSIACRGYITDMWWSKGEIVFFRREGHAVNRTTLYGWVPGTEETRTILETNDLLNDCEIAENRLICIHEASTQPRRIVALDLDGGSMATIVDPNPDFRNIIFSKVERLEWANDFGDETFGDLVYPLNYQDGERYPLVIVQYRSRGFLRGGIGDEYPIHVLAANGFAVLSFDEPTMWESLERLPVVEYEQEVWKDNREKRGILSSLETAIDILDTRGIIDPTRVGISGLSSGADTINFALIHADLFAAAVMSGGTWSPSSYYFSPKWIQDFNRRRGFGYPGSEDDRYWSTMSIARHPEKVEAPLLLQAASTEYLGDMQALTALQHYDKPVEMFVFPEEYHIKWQPAHRYNIYRRNVQWFKFWLQGVEDSDPLDSDQYERWRKLRRKHDEAKTE